MKMVRAIFLSSNKSTAEVAVPLSHYFLHSSRQKLVACSIPGRAFLFLLNTSQFPVLSAIASQLFLPRHQLQVCGR